MARVRRHADLGSREARRRLKTRAEPYWLVIERGLSLGYRKSDEGGSWAVRRYDSARRRHFEHGIATADDFRDADGREVLDFSQAQRKALADAKHDAMRASGQLYTVQDAVADYMAHLRAHRKTAKDTEFKLNAYVSPELASKRVVDLVPADFDSWLSWALKRRRKAKNATRLKREVAAHDTKLEMTPVEQADRQRRRKSTVNRVMTALKACLNHAYASGKVPSREAWARFKKFRSVDSARLRWLSIEEAKRLQNACSATFRPLVRAALLTGCRAGELLALRASDFDPRSKTLLIADSKSGKPRRVPLTDQGAALFDGLTAGIAHEAPVFVRGDGSSWYRVAVIREMRAACAGGGISPPATFHTLRHTYASHLVQEGVPLLFVASALGHGDTRMVEKHYGHLAPSQVAEMIRAKLPSFGEDAPAKVRRIRAS
jgi:integrase